MCTMKHVRELKKFAEKLGFEVEVKQRKNSHVGLHLSRHDGESALLIIGSTPSDHKATLNNHAFIRRFTKEPK